MRYRLWVLVVKRQVSSSGRSGIPQPAPSPLWGTLTLSYNYLGLGTGANVTVIATLIFVIVVTIFCCSSAGRGACHGRGNLAELKRAQTGDIITQPVAGYSSSEATSTEL